MGSFIVRSTAGPRRIDGRPLSGLKRIFIEVVVAPSQGLRPWPGTVAPSGDKPPTCLFSPPVITLEGSPGSRLARSLVAASGGDRGEQVFDRGVVVGQDDPSRADLDLLLVESLAGPPRPQWQLQEEMMARQMFRRTEKGLCLEPD